MSFLRTKAPAILFQLVWPTICARSRSYLWTRLFDTKCLFRSTPLRALLYTWSSHLNAFLAVTKPIYWQSRHTLNSVHFADSSADNMAPEHMMLKLLLALGLFFPRHVTTDSNITCIVPSVERGEETNITCNFGDIMKGATDDFVIQHYKEGGEFREILFCFPYNSELDCLQYEPGYYSHGLDNGIFTLTIQNATEDHEGRYQCQVVPSLPDRTESCCFTLKEHPEDTTSGDTTAGDTDNQTVFTLVIGLVLGGAGVVVAVVICFLCRKRLCARHRRGREIDGCVETASFTNRDSGNVSTLDEETNLQLKQQTEEDKEQTENQEAQSLIKNEACQPDSFSLPTDNFTAREDSSHVYSEQNANHQAYDQALKALQQTGAVIIAGPEKCGKTTLGRKLLNHLHKEGYSTETSLRDPTMWSSYVHDPDKKYAFLFDERFKAGDRAISQNTWTHCFRNLRERHCPLVIIVQTSERKEEDVQAFPFLRNIPVVFAVGEKTKDSASKTITEKEDEPRREVWYTTVDPSGKVGRAARGVKTYKEGEKSEEHKLDLVIFNVHENIGRGPEADENLVKRMLKEAGVSDSELREVTCITRFGEKKDWPPRPVIITVKTIETKQDIIDHARNFTPRVHIRPYTTERRIETQRELFGRI